MAERRVERVMGIPVGMDVRDPDVGRAAVDAAFAWLRRVDRRFSTWDARSDVRALERGARLDEVHPDVRAVLAACEALRRATGGAFDVRAARPGGIDPSGYVKGWAVDGAVALLRAAGARNLCVHAGGDVRVCGAPAPGARWRVGVQHPLRRDRLAAVVSVDDAAVATSGTYERGAHIVDPATGRPPSGVLSVTVVGPDLARADAYATAAFAKGEAGPAWTATLDGYGAMTILADGRVRSTPAFLRHCVGGSVASSLAAAA